MRKIGYQVFSLSLALSSLACGRSRHDDGAAPQKQDAPVVSAIDTSPAPVVENLTNKDTTESKEATESLARADEKAHALGVTEASRSVRAQVKLNKAAIFDRTFLYGFDLQYSSGADAEYDLIDQSIALGHVPATFRRVGDVLQLVADQSRLFESDINHPEALINEYRVVAEDSETISIEFERGGLLLNESANGTGAEAPKATWVRSVTFVEDGSYFLQESAILQKDGNVQTFMESLFPRDSLVPGDYQPILADATREALADRYRFIGNESVFLPFDNDGVTTREETTVANRYHLGESGTIDWYVTPNIPDKFLLPVKSGVEGWNRYFEAQLGRKVMVFKGRLPAGVAIGDPRYNVINWDSVAQAGAAYESQASDPTTGIQSHSLIYLPLAWYNIGSDLWHRRVDGGSVDARTLLSRLEPKGAAAVFGKGRKVLRCARSVSDVMATASELVAQIENEGTENAISTDEFGMRILTSTLFHEVGHALGLAHEFKGSLSFDGTQPVSESNPTSWSIMDYNFYQHELDLFGELGTSDGPKLEYDRQIISQLYNGGADVSETDKVIPACEDAEADNTEGGVDPTCNRYDAESNPAVGLQHSFNNIVNATGAAGYERRTLAEAIADVKPAVVSKLGASATDGDALIEKAGDLGDKVGELVRFYIASGAQSLKANIGDNDKGLRVWSTDEGLDEALVRGIYRDTYTAALSWKKLPAVPAAAAELLKTTVRDTVLANPAAGTDATARAATADAALEAFTDALDAKIEFSLNRLHLGVIGVLGFADANPFAVRLGPTGTNFDFEAWGAKILADLTLEGLDTLSSDEIPARAEIRATAAAQLATFKAVDETIYDNTVAVLKSLVSKGRTDGNQNLVNSARALLATLGG